MEQIGLFLSVNTVILLGLNSLRSQNKQIFIWPINKTQMKKKILFRRDFKK